MSDVLKYEIENGIIDIAEIQLRVDDMRKTKYIENHDQAIWESGGYWFTHVKTSRGRKLLKRKTRESLNELMEKLRCQVRKNRKAGSGPVLASGMAEYVPETDGFVSDVFDRADREMYEDKQDLKKG